MSEKTDPTLLNAYIDGELSHAEAADVMTAAAEDPAVARELSALMRTKAALAGTAVAPPLALKPPPRSRRIRYAAAAAAALAIAVSAFYSVTPTGSDPTIDAPWTATAHRGWTGAEPPAALRPATAGGFVSFGRSAAYIPDLAAARLSVAHIGEVPLVSGRSALIVGYRGTRGCALTVAIVEATEIGGDGIHRLAADGLRGRAWRAGAFGYYVVAEGMAESRFDGIANGIREATLRHAPMSPETRTALARSRASSPPCKA
jgi:hypothetical protein